MYNKIDTESNRSEVWKYYLIVGVASIFSAAIAFVRGADKITDPTQSVDFQNGTVIGTGLAVGLLVWLVVHFLLIRAATKAQKFTAFALIMTVSAIAAVVGHSFQ